MRASIQEAGGRWQVTLKVLMREGCYASVPPFVLTPEASVTDDDVEGAQAEEGGAAGGDQPQAL